ncbi:Cna B-type domain-containing protein [Streptococcus equi]|uniref:Cna B-type domain-containing protein n=1 Tax=Streptococcus equi TaxID=1336 RepID=UPI0039C63E18
MGRQGNQDGKRPKEITVRLLANDAATDKVATAQSKPAGSMHLPIYRNTKMVNRSPTRSKRTLWQITPQPFEALILPIIMR